MIYTLIKKNKDNFSLDLLEEGKTLSRNQYKSLREKIPFTHALFCQSDNVHNRFNVILRRVIEVPPPITPRYVPCTDKEEIKFFVEGIEPLN